MPITAKGFPMIHMQDSADKQWLRPSWRYGPLRRVWLDRPIDPEALEFWLTLTFIVCAAGFVLGYFGGML